MISITGKKGFSIAMSNGITVSVQFGPGNYCEMRDADFTAPEQSIEDWNSQTAEVAAFYTDADANGPDWIQVDGFTGGGDDVSGWNDADRVAEFISKVAAMPPRTDTDNDDNGSNGGSDGEPDDGQEKDEPEGETTKWFNFRQNNSGGVFCEPAINVAVEANSADQANDIAQKHGIYFYGSGDCSCCGNRWSEVSKWDEEDELVVWGTEEISRYASFSKGKGVSVWMAVYKDGGVAFAG